jgi:anti-sigma regulatory factor (Ser/Thr protein kinase)
MKSELEFASHPGNLCLVREFVRRFLGPIALPACEKDLIILGLDEACTNVIRYAYRHAPDHPIHLVCELAGNQIVFRLRDFGTPCEPAQLVCRSLDPSRPGGLGLHLIRRAFSSVDFQPRDEGTELVLCKDINGSADG